MAKLSDIAKVVIDLRTAAIAKASFGIPMIAARLGTAFTDRVYTFEDLGSAQDKVGADGKTHLPDYVIKAVQIAFSQTPRIERVVVGNLFTTVLKLVTIDGTRFGSAGGGVIIDPSADFSVAIDGQPYSITPDAQDTLATVTDKLFQAVNIVGVNTRYDIKSDGAAGTISLTIQAAGQVADVIAGASTDVTESDTMQGTYPTQLHEIQGVDNSWYGFAVMGAPDSDQDDIAGWAEGTEPFVQYWGTSDTANIWTDQAGDVLDALRNKKYHRTVFVPSAKAGEEHPQVAAMARFFVGEPGSIIAGLKTLTGVTVSPFTADQSTTVRGKNGNTYERYAANVFVFNPGKTVAGDWADEIRDRDWLVNYIQTSMASALLRAPKIPYTNPGITSLVNVLNGCLVYAQQKGVIAPDQIDSLGNTVPGFTIVAPNALDVPFDIKASRVLTLKFTALLAGAIQQVEVHGVLTYSYEGA